MRVAYRGLMVSRSIYRSQSHQNRAAMHELENKLRSIAEREASVPKAYEMLEIVTNVVGELEDAGDDLVNNSVCTKKGKAPIKMAASSAD